MDQEDDGDFFSQDFFKGDLKLCHSFARIEPIPTADHS